MTERRMITHHVFPPIPIRTSDWCAYYDDIGPEDGPCGWGATEEDAIRDLKENFDVEAV